MKKYVNLLPQTQQASLRLAKISSLVLSFGIWVVLSLLVTAALLFAAQVYLGKKLEAATILLASRGDELGKLEQSVRKGEIEDLNLDLLNLQKLTGQSENLGPVLMEFAKLLPPDVTVDSITIMRADKKIEAAGRAGTRTSVLKLRQNILGSEFFKNVNFPLLNLEKPTDTNWKYRFFINPEKLKAPM